MLPFPGAVVRTGYKQRGRYWSLDRRNGQGVHTGIDFPAPAGTPLFACVGGKVVAVDYTDSYGWRVTIESVVNGQRGRDYYCHQPSRKAITVNVGEVVSAGDRIGAVGSTGNVTGPHLHLERRIAPYTFSLASFVDPTQLLANDPGAPAGQEADSVTRRSPDEYNWDELEFDTTLLTKHFTSQSSKDVRFIVVHHMTIIGDGDGSALDTCYNVWQSREASAHYGIDGNLVRQYVWDKDYAWATGDTAGNRYGISIEHANSAAGPKWTVAEKTWKTGARLAGYLHHFYKVGRPVKDKTLRKHSSFKATACPGPYIDSIWSDYVAEAQRVYDSLVNGDSPTPPEPEPQPKPLTYTVKAGDTFWGISRAHDTTVQALREWNPGIDPNTMPIGTVLNLSAPADEPEPAPEPEPEPIRTPLVAEWRVTLDHKWGLDGPHGDRKYERQAGYHLYTKETVVIDGHRWYITRWGTWYDGHHLVPWVDAEPEPDPVQDPVQPDPEPEPEPEQPKVGEARIATGNVNSGFRSTAQYRSHIPGMARIFEKSRASVRFVNEAGNQDDATRLCNSFGPEWRYTREQGRDERLSSAIMFDADKEDLLDSGRWDISSSTHDNATWGLFRIKDSGVVWFGGTTLLWPFPIGPNNTSRDDKIRRDSAKSMLRQSRDYCEAEAKRRGLKHIPIVVGGDLNHPAYDKPDVIGEAFDAYGFTDSDRAAEHRINGDKGTTANKDGKFDRGNRIDRFGIDDRGVVCGEQETIFGYPHMDHNIVVISTSLTNE